MHKIIDNKGKAYFVFGFPNQTDAAIYFGTLFPDSVIANIEQQNGILVLPPAMPIIYYGNTEIFGPFFDESSRDAFTNEMGESRKLGTGFFRKMELKHPNTF